MKNVPMTIFHYFDIWHLKKSKDIPIFTIIVDCTGAKKQCERHLHWSATSTFNGSGRVILAKFKGFLNHVINNHSGFSDPLFNKCAHGNIEPQKWLRSGMFIGEVLQK